ncbi:hypothetical protein, partial [Priestia megaterium]
APPSFGPIMPPTQPSFGPVPQFAPAPPSFGPTQPPTTHGHNPGHVYYPQTYLHCSCGSIY